MNAPFHPERPLAKRSERTLTMLIVAKLRAGNREGICRVRNVSKGGMMIESRMPLDCGQPVMLDVRDQAGLQGSIAWVRGERSGIRLESELALDGLLSAPPARPSRVTRTKVGRGPRLEVQCEVEVELASGRLKAALKDISQGGAKLSMPLVVQRDERLLLMIPGLPMKLALVRWAGSEIGVAFAEPLSFGTLGEWLLTRADGVVEVRPTER